MKTIANMFMGLRIQSTKIMLVATLLVTGNCSLITVTAQVTIGSLDEPAKGALLELKTQTNLTGGATTDKGGLLLPRVQLQTLTSLQPFIDAATSADKLEHTGLEVYNVTDDATFKPGIYYWNGNQWKQPSGAGTAIYLPSFNLAWASGVTTTVNLYDVYTRNFTTSTRSLISDDPALTVATALTSMLGVAGDYNYVVTDYDADCMTINNISANGVMSYTCTTTAPTSGSYVNIILIRK